MPQYFGSTALFAAQVDGVGDSVPDAAYGDDPRLVCDCIGKVAAGWIEIEGHVNLPPRARGLRRARIPVCRVVDCSVLLRTCRLHAIKDRLGDSVKCLAIAHDKLSVISNNEKNFNAPFLVRHC